MVDKCVAYFFKKLDRCTIVILYFGYDLIFTINTKGEILDYFHDLGCIALSPILLYSNHNIDFSFVGFDPV
jgi:hypothetical protein